MHTFELEQFLKKEIPLAEAIGISLLHVSDTKIEIEAPLQPNSNHLETAFGGSLNSILILSCYAWLFHRLQQKSLTGNVLIKSGQTLYHHPVKENLKAICLAPDEEIFDRFLKTYLRVGKSRISLSASVFTSFGKACSFTGEFVAILKD